MPRAANAATGRIASHGAMYRHRSGVLLVVLAALVAVLVAVLVGRGVREHGGSNSYALLAEALLSGRPYVDRCFEVDCALVNGHQYIVFPPLPAVVMMPFVLVSGSQAACFTFVAIVAAAIALALWWRIIGRCGVRGQARVWLLCAIACASPLYYVTLRSSTIWCFAQAIAFPLLTLAIHEAQAGRLIRSGLALGGAFLCRQMSIFYAPILLVLALPDGAPLLAINRTMIGRAMRLGVPVLCAVACYLAYNYWRFGALMDTGYFQINFPGNVTGPRVAQYGVWNVHYVLFNAFYMFLQGFHVDFADPQRVHIVGMDAGGTALLAASPWLLFLFFTPPRRVYLLCATLVTAFVVVLLFYHSNGFAQYNTQRYALDWIPAALLMLAGALRQRDTIEFRLLVLWGATLNVATVFVLAHT
ncbi:MAG TPA: hypothetical protein VFG12_09995 [Rhodopila sp.]|nr:hypothetical protein [Rhodopila sp.]